MLHHSNRWHVNQMKLRVPEIKPIEHVWSEHKVCRAAGGVHGFSAGFGARRKVTGSEAAFMALLKAKGNEFRENQKEAIQCGPLVNSAVGLDRPRNWFTHWSTLSNWFGSVWDQPEFELISELETDMAECDSVEVGVAHTGHFWSEAQ